MFPLEEGFGEPWFPEFVFGITNFRVGLASLILAFAFGKRVRWRFPEGGSCVR